MTPFLLESGAKLHLFPSCFFQTFNHFFHLFCMTNSFRRRSLRTKATSPLDESRPLWSHACWEPEPVARKTPLKVCALL